MIVISTISEFAPVDPAELPTTVTTLLFVVVESVVVNIYDDDDDDDDDDETKLKNDVTFLSFSLLLPPSETFLLQFYDNERH